MTLQEIRAIARKKRVKPDGLSKVQLVRVIQKTEGNFDCFASASLGECDQSGCTWRNDCFKEAKSL